MAELTASRLREVMNYSPATGIFTWAVTRGNKCIRGLPAGHRNHGGYIQIRIDGTSYLAHRLAWLHVTGEWPAGLLDHIDRNPSNNSFANLRIATHSQNHANTGLRADNTSGTKGVSWCADRRKWQAGIVINGRRKNLGYFSGIDAARNAYAAASKAAFGEFSHGAQN